MRFAFRVDSSPIIGMGHLMRCLTLANGLKKRGFECYFICRNFEGNGARKFIDNDFSLDLLSVEGLELSKDWLGVPFEKDLKDVVDVVSKKPIDWLIVDHYEIDHKWQKEFRIKFPKAKIMVIDDLLRSHDCDLLLDQTYGRKPEDYRSLVPQTADLCLGTKFALLREEFTALRSQIHQKPDHKDEHLADLKHLGPRVELISFSNDMAGLMAKADFAIGAGGGTSWERCCLGLPTIVLTLADNQIEIAKILSEKKAGISVSTEKQQISDAVEKLLVYPQLLMSMSKNAASLCDGKGVGRVINRILCNSFEFKDANASDAQFIFDARYLGGASSFYRNKEIPSFQSHVSWLESAFDNENILLLCASLCGVKVAHVRLDKSGSISGEIGICLAEDWRGRGVGRVVLESANQYFSTLGFSKIYAEVHEHNQPSVNIFERAGYTYLSTDSEGFMRYLWQA